MKDTLMKYFLGFLIVILLFSAQSRLGQSLDSSKVQKLMELGFYPYPSLADLEINSLPDSLLQVTHLSSSDIDLNFSNTGDLGWINDVAIQNKVLLIGEEHYHQVIANLRNRLVFYLNTIDTYPLLVMEAQYSYTPYYNYFLNLPDDNEAEVYFSKTLYNMVGSEDKRDLLHHLRVWNQTHPLKKIFIGFSDIEHDYATTLSQVIIPYFKSIDTQNYRDRKTQSLQEIAKLLPHFFKLLETAKEKGLRGEYPFITPQFIQNVLLNLQSTYWAYEFEFNTYRQKAIIRNLTDQDFLGSFLVKGKAVIYGGSFHMTTHYSYPEHLNFFREGSYLAEDFPLTKGKVYSISFHSFARSLEKMADRSIDSCLKQGSYYISLVKKWQTAHNEKLIDANDNLLDFQMNDLHRLILRKALKAGNSPLLVNSIDWNEMLAIAEKRDAGAFNDLKGWKDDYIRYDAHIFIPCSPFITAAKKIP